MYPVLERAKNEERPTASDWEEVASSIRRQQQCLVDPDALEAGRLLGRICERHSLSEEQGEDDETTIRLIAGILNRDPAGAIGTQLQETADLSEANREDIHALNAAVDRLVRRMPQFADIFDVLGASANELWLSTNLAYHALMPHSAW